MSSQNPIIKNVVHAGQKYIPIADGSKVILLNCLHKYSIQLKIMFTSIFRRIFIFKLGS